MKKRHHLGVFLLFTKSTTGINFIWPFPYEPFYATKKHTLNRMRPLQKPTGKMTGLIPANQKRTILWQKKPQAIHTTSDKYKIKPVM